MSLPILTAAELRSEFKTFSGSCWRVVENQFKNSTRKLVDSDKEQEILEELIEETKPPVPSTCQDLHYLLATPFRYPSPKGSRFRTPYQSGVFYAALNLPTALAEITYHRILFFIESPYTPWPEAPLEFTAFKTRVKGDRVLDLTTHPLNKHRQAWMHPHDYSACQIFSKLARKIQAEAIRYVSVRDPLERHNLAILDCKFFDEKEPYLKENLLSTFDKKNKASNWYNQSRNLSISFNDLLYS